VIRIHFTEPTSDPWIRWKERCQTASGQLVTACQHGQALEVTGLYKEQKDVYVLREGPFFGKCAYCESLIAADQPGDLDHFRPKNRITNADGRPVLIRDGNGKEIPHPGYYWLAYDWRNLLPSCEDCNRPSRQKTKKLIGKWDQFPVRGAHAQNPGDEAHEQPLIINPTIQDPTDHLSVDATGVLVPKTDEGATCIELFGLNDRVALVECRSRMYHDTKTKFFAYVTAKLFRSEIEAERLAQELKQIQNGGLPYSMSGRVAIADEAGQLDAGLETLRER
jgi:hypothetical protein